MNRPTARAVTLAMSVAAATVLVTTPASVSGAPPPVKASATVTIKAEGTDLSGRLSSGRHVCEAERKVIVMKQKGARGGADDQNFASDTTDRQGGVWKWSTGNTGTEGRFYAKVRATPDCKSDTSPTIRASRND